MRISHPTASCHVGCSSILFGCGSAALCSFAAISFWLRLGRAGRFEPLLRQISPHPPFNQIQVDSSKFKRFAQGISPRPSLSCHRVPLQSAIRNPQSPPALQYISKSLCFMAIAPKQRPLLRCNSEESCNSKKVFATKERKDRIDKNLCCFSLRSLCSFAAVSFWLRLGRAGRFEPFRGTSIQVPCPERLAHEIAPFQSCLIRPNQGIFFCHRAGQIPRSITTPFHL